MSLLVKEVFRTLQGEGRWAGTPSVFVRLAGCNLWSGSEEDRERDARDKDVRCPLFCDTEFVGGERLDVDELADRIGQLAGASSADQDLVVRHVVFTGGEPLVQLNRHPELLDVVRSRFRGWVRLALETNGTVFPHHELEFDWVCVSPKVLLDELELSRGDELKVVFPAHDPLGYRILEFGFEELLVQPEAPPAPGSVAAQDILARAVAFCLANPRWKLSVQMHKVVDIP